MGRGSATCGRPASGEILAPVTGFRVPPYRGQSPQCCAFSEAVARGLAALAGVRGRLCVSSSIKRTGAADPLLSFTLSPRQAAIQQWPSKPPRLRTQVLIALRAISRLPVTVVVTSALPMSVAFAPAKPPPGAKQATEQGARAQRLCPARLASRVSTTSLESRPRSRRAARSLW